MPPTIEHPNPPTHERDCSAEIEWRNYKVNLHGRSSAEFWHNGKWVGSDDKGVISVTHPDYRHEAVKVSESVTVIKIYCKVSS
jgi:hypothetical protein